MMRLNSKFIFLSSCYSFSRLCLSERLSTEAVFQNQFVPELELSDQQNPGPLIIKRENTINSNSENVSNNNSGNTNSNGINTFFGAIGDFFISKKQAFKEQAEQQLLRELAAGPTQRELDHWKMVAEERKRGWTCPDKTYYPPNDLELKWDCRLWRSAKKWSTRMATENFIAHRHNGSTSCSRTEAEGYPKNRGCGECIAGGSYSNADAIKQLKKSNSHCHGMFTTTFNHFGAGFAQNKASTYVDYWTESYGDWHNYEPDQECIGGSPATYALPGCEDIDTMNCAHYRDNGYCQISDNVKKQCKDTCAVVLNDKDCIQNKPGGNCVDIEKNHCDHYKSVGYCTNEHIMTQCAKTCGVCGSDGSNAPPAPTPPVSQCVDKEQNHCPLYKENGYCSGDNMKTHCAKTCGYC